MGERKGPETPCPERLSRFWNTGPPGELAYRPYQDVVEERIQAAMAAGEFDHLPGKGRPLRLGSPHPWEEKHWLEHHILANAKVLPEWIELDREIRCGLERLRQGRLAPPDREVLLADLNRKIDRFNLLVPSLSLQRPRIR